MGIGMGATFVSITIAATSGVPHRESGLASGILNTSQQIGGALGLAILTGLAASGAARFLQHLTSAPTKLTPLAAQVHGFHIAYLTAGFFFIGAATVATLLLKQPKNLKNIEAELATAAH